MDGGAVAAMAAAAAANKGKAESSSSLSLSSVKIDPVLEEESSAKTTAGEVRNASACHKEETNVVELHPRKRKLKSKPEPTHMEVDHNLPSFSSIPHPHEVPVTNCYQMFMDIRKQVGAPKSRDGKIER